MSIATCRFRWKKAAWALGLLSACLLHAVARADDANDDKLVNCGNEKVVLFRGSTSPDGRYAIGWTLKPNSPRAKAVDWSKWKPEDDDRSSFYESYNFLDPEVTGSGMAPLMDAMKSAPAKSGAAHTENLPPYELSNYVVDLREKRMVQLESDWPYWPNKNHGDLVVVWSQRGRDGTPVYAIVVNGARWFSHDIWLVTVDKNGMRATVLTEALRKAVDKLMKEKRPLSYSAYGTYYLQSEGHSNVFTDTKAQIDFSSEVPKINYEDVEGTVIVDLATGKVVKTESTSARDNPFLDNPKLAKADRELNKVYAELMAKLSEPQRKALKDEQRIWLASRDYGEPIDENSKLSASVIAFASDHKSAVPTSIEGYEDYEYSFNDKRDASLIQSTKARTAELVKRLRK